MSEEMARYLCTLIYVDYNSHKPEEVEAILTDRDYETLVGWFMKGRFEIAEQFLKRKLKEILK